MTDQKILEAATAIKNHLIQLASNNNLPSDIAQLDIQSLVDIITGHQPTSEEKAIIEASHYLCESDLSIKEQVEAIVDQFYKDGSVMIDDVEGVVVWQPLENTFDCDEFLVLIGWDLF